MDDLADMLQYSGRMWQLTGDELEEHAWLVSLGLSEDAALELVWARRQRWL